MRYFLLMILSLLDLSAAAQSSAEISIQDAWVRRVPQNSRVTAAYMRINNQSKADDELIAVSSSIAKSCELHQTKMEAGIHRMEKLKSLAIPAASVIELQPTGAHIMMFQIDQESLKKSKSAPINLRFKRAGRISVQAVIRD